ncbi:MAG: 4-hydroxythreonine-4-phosphate dehydrogenase PdxA [Planctomycetota bacterium]
MRPVEDSPRDVPTIGITMGDPAGIGAEVAIKALADHSLRERANFIVYGLHEHIACASDLAELLPFWKRMPQVDVAAGNAPPSPPQGVVIADFDDCPINGRLLRKPTAEAGRASMRFLDEAITAAQQRRIDAIVTGPIDKTAWGMAGFRYAGHTELLADRCKTSRVTMMFAAGPLRVALASIHVALFDLRHAFTIGLVFQPIDLLHQALRDWYGISRPRIAVAGLNPHAGEHGRFGDEETRVIEPAMEMARNAHIDAVGPFPADTLFWRAAQGEFDGVVAMYHDQALIPVKLLAFDRAVNVTLGLPIIRTSVDHGTAYDIVGKNAADPGSMKAAIRLAIELAEGRRKSAARVATTPPGQLT